MNKYVYPAIFTPESTGWSIHFPDLEGCYTCGDDLKDGTGCPGPGSIWI